MGLFGSNRWEGARPKDAIILRDALILVMEELAKDAPWTEVRRLEELVARLERFPSPTGVVKQVESAIRGMRGTAIQSGSADFANAALALVDALKSCAIRDKELYEAITELREGIPLRIRESDARWVSRHAAHLEEISKPVRHRHLEAQDEISILLGTVGKHLDAANVTNERMGGHLGEMAQTLSAKRDAAGLRSLRLELSQILGRVEEERRLLAEQLNEANARTGELEQTVQLQNEQIVGFRVKVALDPLTAVANRSAFDEAFANALRGSKHSGRTLCMLVMDLDHFKQVNDTFGHSAGDDVLRAVAQVVGKCLRQDDFVARIGGEEFAALLPDTNKRAAMGVADRIRRTIRDVPFTHHGQSFQVTMSIGVGVWNGKEGGDAFFERTDAAMYEAKRQGRDRFHLA